MKKKSKGENWCCFTDGFLFNGSFDTEQEAREKANRHNRNYEGFCSVRCLTDKEFREMIGFHERTTSDMQLAKGVHALTVRTRRDTWHRG